MSSQTSKALFFIMTTMFVFVNTSQERFLLIELDEEYEDKDVRPITIRPTGDGRPTSTHLEFSTQSGNPATMPTTVDETVTINKTVNESLESLKSDEAPLSIEDIENIENDINFDDLRKARTHNTERGSKGLRILGGKVIIISFVELF